jgi:23S rRNA (adenine2503-C2)-methyltransferase
MNNAICGMTSTDLYEVLSQHGFNRAQTDKVLSGIYRKGVTQISKIEGVPKALKELLAAQFITGVYTPVSSQKSADNTVKFLFRNPDGLKFETVYLPDNKRKTVCISTQSGCRMGCPFCVTGRFGFRGNLSAGDMINQIISLPEARGVTHVVFMGMGEPMDNLEEALKACRIITSESGLAISSRNITVSTVGILPGLQEFIEKSDCNLTLSLYSPFPEERQLVVPAENRYPAHQIIDLMKSYPLMKKRRFSIAYVMMSDVNDTDRHLEALKRLLKDSPIRVNLIPYHHIGDDHNRSSTKARMEFFKHNLVISGISASIRKSRGEDISAACGLLASGLDNK